MKSDHFAQPKFISEIAKNLRYGDESKIAKRADVSIGIMSRYLNPNSEEESTLFKAACVLTAWIDTDKDGGQGALETFIAFVSRACPADDSLDLDTERAKTYQCIHDYTLDEANHADPDTILRDLVTARDQLNIDIAAINSVRARRHEEAEQQRAKQRDVFKGQAVNHGTRERAKEIVGRTGYRG